MMDRISSTTLTSVSISRQHDLKDISDPIFHSLSETLDLGHSEQRNASPSRASIHSTHSQSGSFTSGVTDSLSVPHLKRRDGSKHMRNLHSVDYPLFPPPHLNHNNTNTVTISKQSSPLRTLQTQSHLGRSNTAPSPKRPPASHSSYGVETTVGPPPSFDTRRTTSTERVWRVDRSKSLRITPGADRVEIHQQVAAPIAPTPLLNSSPDTADTESVPTPTDVEELTIMDVTAQATGSAGLGLSNSEAETKSSNGSHKSEDLFLNIARVDAGRPSSSKGSEKRKSRISLPYLSSNIRPATSHAPEMLADSSAPTPRAELSSYHSKRASLQFSQPRGGDQVSDTGSADASNSGYFSKRSSTIYADTIRPVQRSATTLRNTRLVSESGYLDKSKFGEQNTTESTTSTTAPSTVWDELDDLKSRIRKLELTGKLPPSSAAAMSSAERPRTATTAATTMSTSPKHNKMPAQISPPVEGVPSAVHPLLQEALANAKTVVSHDVFQKLQSAAQDALQLASLTTYDATGRNITTAMTDRQIRRRTESLCRSLTELAIALSTEQAVKQTTVAYRPNSRDQHISPAVGTFRSRAYSQSNEERMPPSVRVQSRLEGRRVSTQVAYTSARHTTPELDSPTALPAYANSGGRTTRVASTFRSRRPQTLGLDGATDEESSSAPAIRPVSRAYTDIAAVRRVSRDTGALQVQAREYTSQHPLPSNTEVSTATRTPLPANLSTNFISRRKFTSPAAAAVAPDSSPLASRQSWGRISIVQDNPPLPPPSDTVSEALGSGSRSVSAKRSLGFASRLGSSVGNRIRAARSESRSYNRDPEMGGEDGGGR